MQSTLQRLMEREEPLVSVLPRQPGTKESRYMHLLSGSAPPAAAAVAREMSKSSLSDDRVSSLEAEVAELRKEIAEMQQQLAAFRKAFE